MCSAFRKVEAIVPALVAARFDGRWLSSNPDYLARLDLFFRSGAGFSPPDATDGPR